MKTYDGATGGTTARLPLLRVSHVKEFAETPLATITSEKIARKIDPVVSDEASQ